MLTGASYYFEGRSSKVRVRFKVLKSCLLELDSSLPADLVEYCLVSKDWIAVRVGASLALLRRFWNEQSS